MLYQKCTFFDTIRRGKYTVTFATWFPTNSTFSAKFHEVSTLVHLPRGLQQISTVSGTIRRGKYTIGFATWFTLNSTFLTKFKVVSTLIHLPRVF